MWSRNGRDLPGKTYLLTRGATEYCELQYCELNSEYCELNSELQNIVSIPFHFPTWIQINKLDTVFLYYRRNWNPRSLVLILLWWEINLDLVIYQPLLSAENKQGCEHQFWTWLRRVSGTWSRNVFSFHGVFGNDLESRKTCEIVTLE